MVEVGFGERLRASVLVGEALQGLRDRAGAMLALWAGVSVILSGLAVVGFNLGLTANPLQMTAERLAYAAAQGLVSSLGAALALRMVLDPEGRFGRWDGRLFACAGLLAVAGLAMSSLSYLNRFAGTAGAVSGMLGSLVYLVGYVAVAWVSVRLTLWPIGVLQGEAGVTPRASWTLMRGCVWLYVRGVILLSIPMVVVTMGIVLVFRVNAQNWPLWALILMAAVGTGQMIAFQAFDAAIYQARAGAVGRSELDVFD